MDIPLGLVVALNAERHLRNAEPHAPQVVPARRARRRGRRARQVD